MMGCTCSQEQRIAETLAKAFGNRLPVCQRGSQVTGQRTAKPFEIACPGRLVQAEFLAQIGERFRCRGLAQDSLGNVAGQQFDTDEYDNRNREKEQDAQPETLGNQFYQRVAHRPAPRL